MAAGSRVGASSPVAYELRLHRAAVRSYRRLHGALRERVRAAIDALADEPRPEGSVKLAGPDDYGARVGDYRIVYAVDAAARTVIVARIADRREVYRR